MSAATRRALLMSMTVTSVRGSNGDCSKINGPLTDERAAVYNGAERKVKKD
jgi:hypothetical protein